MPSAFENLCGPGKPLKAELPDAKEFAGLKRSGLARLKDAATPSLSLVALGQHAPDLGATPQGVRQEQPDGPLLAGRQQW